MIIAISAMALAFQVAGAPQGIVAPSLIENVQYGGMPVRRPPCGHGWDLSASDGLCYPNGYLPPQAQAARQFPRYYREGRYPVPCGHGADVDSRDGQCYPTGTVPRQFQEGRQHYYGDYYEGRRGRRYYNY